jgi:hypothetical protein
MTIQVDHEYHGVEVSRMSPEVYTWLETRMGMSGERWFIKGHFGSATIFFRDPKDHTMFLLSWGL